MQINRTKNATRNIIFGTILKIYQILLPFVIRTVIIYVLGIEYVGLNSLFTAVLQVLNLAELGVGSAMVFSMYKPIVEDDDDTISALMQLYKFYYRIIGAVILIVGLVLLPFIPKLISGDIPKDINIYLLYLLNLFATVLTYWLFAYKSSILQAFQRNDLISKVTIITDTIKYILQIGLLFIFSNYYYYVIVIIATQIGTNIFTAYIADRYYPQYKPKGQLPKEKILMINRRIKDLFTSKLGGIVVNSADSVVISAFLGLKVLAIYQNYFFILSSIIGFVTIIYVSCTAGIGNSIIVETKEKNFSDLKKFTFLISWIAGFCTCCLLCLYQPFIKMWVGEKYKLQFSVVICFCIYYFIYEINQLWNLYKDAAGIWHNDKYRVLVTAFTNLVLNLSTVKSFGVYGIILSTVLSMLFVGIPWLMYNLFTTIFEIKYLYTYIKRVFLYVITTTIACIITYTTCMLCTQYLWNSIISIAIICVIIPNLIFFIVYYRMPEFKQSLVMISKITKGKLKISVNNLE